MQSVIDKIDNFWNEDGKSHSELAISYCKILRDGRQNIERQIHELGNRSAAIRYRHHREEEDSATKTTYRIELIDRQRDISREIRRQLDDLDTLTMTSKTSRASLKRNDKIFDARQISQRSPDIMAKEIKADYLARWKRYNLKQKNKLQVLCQSYSHRKRHFMLRVFKVWRRFMAEKKNCTVKMQWIIEKCAARKLENYIHLWLKHTSMSCSIRRLELAHDKRHESILFKAWKKLVDSLTAIRKLQSKQGHLCKIFVFTEWCRITELHRSIEVCKNKTRCALLAIVWNKWLILRLQRKAIAAKIHDFTLLDCGRKCSAALRAWFALKNKSKLLQILFRRAKIFTTLWALNVWMHAYHNRLQIKNDCLNMLGRFRKKLTLKAFESWKTYQSVAQQRSKRLYVLIKKQIARSACQELIIAAKKCRDRRVQVASRKTRRFLWEWYDHSVKAMRTRALAQMMHYRQSRLLLKETAWCPWKIALRLRQQSHKADQYFQTKFRKEAWKALVIALSRQIAIKRSCYLLTQLLKRRCVSFGVATWSKFCYKSKEQRKLLKYADDIHIDSLIVKGFYRWEVFIKTEHERELLRVKTTRLFMRSSLRRWHHNSEIQKLHLGKISQSIVHISNRNTMVEILRCWGRKKHERHSKRVKKWLYCWKNSCRQQQGIYLLQRIKSHWVCRRIWQNWHIFVVRRIARTDLAYRISQETSLYWRKILMQKWRKFTLARDIGRIKISKVYREQKLQKTILKWRRHTVISQAMTRSYLTRRKMVVNDSLLYWYHTTIEYLALASRFYRMRQQQKCFNKWHDITKIKNTIWHIHGIILSSEVGNALSKWCQYTLESLTKRWIVAHSSNLAKRFLLSRYFFPWKEKSAHTKRLKQLFEHQRSEVIRAALKTWREKYYVCQIFAQIHNKYTRQILLQTWMSWVAFTKKRKVGMALLHHIYISYIINRVFCAWKYYHAHLRQVDFVLSLRISQQRHLMARESFQAWSNRVRVSTRVNLFVFGQQRRQVSQSFYRCTIFLKLMRAYRQRKIRMMHKVFWLGLRRYAIWKQLTCYLQIKRELLIKKISFVAWQNSHRCRIVALIQLEQRKVNSMYQYFLVWRRACEKRKERTKLIHRHYMQQRSSLAFCEARKLQTVLSYKRMGMLLLRKEVYWRDS